jgi:chemotaxis protein CheD
VFEATLQTCVSTHVGPGQMMVSSGARILRTVLGSCVSVCLWDPNLGVGGMNHFMLPESASPFVACLRHGDVAMRVLLREMLASGSRANQLSARVYGGANVLEAFTSANHLGARNVRFALDWLESERIVVDAQHLLGTSARRVEFDLRTGSTGVRLLGGAK